MLLSCWDSDRKRRNHDMLRRASVLQAAGASSAFGIAHSSNLLAPVYKDIKKDKHDSYACLLRSNANMAGLGLSLF